MCSSATEGGGGRVHGRSENKREKNPKAGGWKSVLSPNQHGKKEWESKKERNVNEAQTLRKHSKRGEKNRQKKGTGNQNALHLRFFGRGIGRPGGEKKGITGKLILREQPVQKKKNREHGVALRPKR